MKALAIRNSFVLGQALVSQHSFPFITIRTVLAKIEGVNGRARGSEIGFEGHKKIEICAFRAVSRITECISIMHCILELKL